MIKCMSMVLIAKKREVVAKGASFPWSECQVMRLATKHKAYRFNMNSGFFVASIVL